jgi:amidohydrolase
MNILKAIDDIEENIIQYRRHLHMYPELSMQEFETSKYIKSILKKHNISYIEGAKTGVIATIGSKNRVVAIRADIDALPLQEETNVSYQSKNKNIMHACGHDAHTAIALASAIVLKQYEESLNGTVKILFQPNEEVSSGALDFINEGLTNDIETIIGLHVMPYLEVGEIEVKDDCLTGSSTSITIKAIGKSAHAAYPQNGIDSIVIMSDIILKLQTIVSRNLPPEEQVALSFGQINGGTKSNIIANTVTAKGTLRTTSNKTKEFMKNRIEEIVKHTALSYNGDYECTFHDGYIPLYNDKEINTIIRNVAKTCNITVKEKKYPSLGVEDFGYYLQNMNGAFFHLGCKEKGNNSGLHGPKFNIDESCLKIGVQIEVLTILELLKKKRDTHA